MAVSAGNLDALVGLTGPAEDLSGLTVSAHASSGVIGSDTLSSISVIATGAPVFGLTRGVNETFKIAAVNNTANSITIVGYFNGNAVGQTNAYVLAYSATTLLLSVSATASNIAQSLDIGSNVDSSIALLSFASIAGGTTITLTPSGTYTGVATTTPPAMGTTSVTGPAVILPGNGGADTVIAATGNSAITTSIGALVFLGSGLNTVTSGGADTIVGGSGSATVSAGPSGDLVFSLAGSLDFIGGGGASTVVAGSVTATLFGGTGGTLMFGNGQTHYFGSAGTDTVVALNGSMTAQGGAGGGLYFGGTAGNNVINAGSGNVTGFGGGAGDVLTATGSASNLFAGGVGAETLTGAGSTGINTFFAGFGPETLIGGGGNTALVAGAGADLLVGGSGLTLFLFVNGRTAAGADTISGFDPTHDFVKLAGYTTTTASVLSGATHANGATTLALSDGTQITFAGVTQLAATSFT